MDTDVSMCFAVRCSALQCVAVCCSVLQCGSACKCGNRCLNLCCSMLQSVPYLCCRMLQGVPGYCRVLQGLAVCWSVLECGQLFERISAAVCECIWWVCACACVCLCVCACVRVCMHANACVRSIMFVLTMRWLWLVGSIEL